jgi:hypothetical protein
VHVVNVEYRKSVASAQFGDYVHLSGGVFRKQLSQRSHTHLQVALMHCASAPRSCHELVPWDYLSLCVDQSNENVYRTLAHCDWRVLQKQSPLIKVNAKVTKSDTSRPVHGYASWIRLKARRNRERPKAAV